MPYFCKWFENRTEFLNNCFQMLDNMSYKTVIPERIKTGEFYNCPSFLPFRQTERMRMIIIASLVKDAVFEIQGRWRAWNVQSKLLKDKVMQIKWPKTLHWILLNLCLNNPGMLWEFTRLDKKQINFWKKHNKKWKLYSEYIPELTQDHEMVGLHPRRDEYFL